MAPNLLRNKNSKTRGIRFKGRDMQTQMAELTGAAAIIRAVYFREVRGDNAAVAAQLKQDLVRANRFGTENLTEEEGKAALERVIEQVENGYGLSQDPWGRDYEERPKIKILKIDGRDIADE